MILLGVFALIFSVTSKQIGSSNGRSEEFQSTTYNTEYKKTSELTNADLNDAYQRNYQKSTSPDGSYLIKSAEWTDKQKGEGLITIQGVQSQELENTSALYVATMCYYHGLTEDILVKNIQTLIQYYDKVDFIGINDLYEAGIVDTKTFTADSSEDEIRNYIVETKNASGNSVPHYTNSIPPAIEKYLFGNMGDEYINEDNLINDPTAIYVSCDSAFLNGSGTRWGIEYATEKYFNFIEEHYGERYFSMSEYSKQDAKPYMYIRSPLSDFYDENVMNIVIGVLNPENYGEADSVLSQASIEQWKNGTGLDSNRALYLPYEDKKYAADYNYSQDFDEAGVQIITNCTIEDTVQDYFEIVDVNTTGGSATMQTKVTGQNVLFYDTNYVSGTEIKIQIKIKINQEMLSSFNRFEDTNVGKATLNGKESLAVDSPKLATIYREDYKPTIDLTEEDKTDENQKNYQEVISTDGSYLTKKAEWTDKEKGEALITLQGAQYQELENTSALYVATLCYQHGLNEDILVKNIQTLVKYYDEVDFIAINGSGEAGIANTKIFTKDSTEEEIRNYIIETKDAGIRFPHAINSIPFAIQKYLFGNAGDNYINENNLIKDPTAIYVSTDSIYLCEEVKNDLAGFWGIEYATEKYFNFIEEKYGDRYFSMSQDSKEDENPELCIRYVMETSYNTNTLNILIGILNPENYGEADLVLSEENLKKWEETTDSTTSNQALYLPYENKKYAADYNYSQDFDEAGVQIITNCTIADTVQDYFEIVDAEATGGSESMQLRVVGQNVSFYDENYVCGTEITIKIKVKLKQDMISHFDGFEDTNLGKATLSGEENISVDSPKLAPITTTYTVNYLEKGTNSKLAEAKTDQNIPINTQIKATDEIIEIAGYNYDSADKEILTLGTGENVINLYYTKRTDLSYKVNYLEKDTNKVLSTQKVVNNQSFGTVINSADEIITIEGYDYDSADKTSLTIGTGTNIINLYYTKKDASVLVHHYIDGTETKVPAKNGGEVADETITGKVDDKYSTNASSNIANNYELVTSKLPTNASGTMTEEQIVVTYYYQLKDPTLTSNISKTSTLNKITSKDQEMPYTITYTANVDTYKGDAEVTIVDTLPYTIDESKSDLAGGTYNAEAKTITWKENITGIDSFASIKNQINITKEIKVVYKDLDVTQANVTNKVTGTINLKTPEKTDTTEVTKDIPTEYLKDVKVTKIWDDNNNSASKRPANVTVVLTGDGKTYKQQLSVQNVVSGNNNNWEYTFTNLPKYNAQGVEIDYVLSEEVSSESNNKFYSANIDQGNKTITNTFTVPDEKVTVTAKKVWNDNNNSAQKRPNSVTLTVTGTGAGVNVSKEQEITSANAVAGDSNAWEYTFTDLPKYDENGDEVEYTINEKDLNNEFYIKSNVDQATRTVTNTFQVPRENIEILVTKIWDDNNNEAGKRPTSVTLQVKNGNEVVAEEEVTEADGWKHTFSVPKYNADGNEINYTIDEKDLGNKFYTKENAVIDQDARTITNKFEVPDEKVSIKVTKVWDDNNNSAGKRPGKVTMVLTGASQAHKQDLTVENADPSNNNNWIYTFNDLPKYDSKGNEINYILSEELDSIYYTSANSKIDQNTKTITNTFKVPTDKISIPVVKVWNDNNNTANKRPDNVVLVLTGNDGSEAHKVTLSGHNADENDGNRWLYTFIDLPKYNATNGDEIVYTLSEEKLNSKFYSTSVEQESKTVTNTFSVPDEKTSVTVRKVWNDNNNTAQKRPESVTLILSASGSEVARQTLTSSNAIEAATNTWEYTFNDLKKYDANGNEIEYTLSEENLNNKFYTSDVNQENKTVTNTFSVPGETVSVTVTKTWNDNNNEAGKRPTSITLKVSGNGKNYTQEVTEANADSSNSNNWVYTFNDLPKYDGNGDEIAYTVDELDLNNEFYIKSSVNQETRTIVNTFQVPGENVTIPVTKIWDDNNDIAKKRPGSITIQVKNGEEVVAESPVTADTEWKHEFTLPKFDNYGNEIKYTIDEADLNNKYYEKGNVDQTAKTITNVSKYGKVIVHYYIEGTQTRVPDINGGEIADVLIEGKQGESYNTNAAENVKQNYELVATPSNATGTISAEDTEVIYYYRLKTPNITNQVINKTGTDRITVANQEMNYSITYRTEITDYIGNAEVTIIDTLPYAIDEGKSDLAGGTYDSTGKTITWTENISDINSFTGNGTVNVTKNFKVVYVGLDMNQEKITNNVKGHIKLLTPEKTSEEVTGSQESTIYKAEIRAEKLVDKTEAIEGEKVTYTIRITNDGNLEKTVTVRDTLPAGITFDKDTLIQVGDTGTVYTEQNLKNGIPVEVPASGSIDVVFAGKVDTLANNEYSKTLKNQATVDNEPTNEVTTNVTKANITAHKEAEPSSGNKVREGDEITYRIRVRNDGTREGTAIVKDTIPAGTTFVEGSVKIDNVADSTKTATDLANGITLNVPISTEKVVEFKVRVNKLIDGTKIKNTAYINQNGEDKKVPEEPEHTYVEPKEEQNISKTGTTTIESLDQEITYNI